MGRKGRNRKRHLINVDPSLEEYSNTTPADYGYQPRPKRPTIERPIYYRMPTQPIYAPRFSDIPPRFSWHSAPQRWVPPVPNWHSRFGSSQVPKRPVAVVPPLHGVNSAYANPIPSTSSTPDSVISSEVQVSAQKTKLADKPSGQNQLVSTKVSKPTVDVRARGDESNINSTSISVSSASIPATVQTQEDTKPSDNAGGDTELNSNIPNVTEDDDVIFLYRVEPSEGKLVEVVDLDENPDGNSSRNLVLSSQNSSSSKESDMKDGQIQNSNDSQEVLEIYPSISMLEQSKGRDLRTNASRKRKRREDVDTHCSVCHKDCDGGITKDGHRLFISKCGHLFCMACLRNLIPYKCTECNAGIANLCKVIF